MGINYTPVILSAAPSSDAVTYDITGLTTLDLAGLQSDNVILTSSNANENITLITNCPAWRVTVSCVATLSCLVTRTAYAAIVNGSVHNSTNQTIQGATGEYITFLPRLKGAVPYVVMDLINCALT